MKHLPMHEVLNITKEVYRGLCSVRDNLLNETYTDFDMRSTQACIGGKCREEIGMDHQTTCLSDLCNIQDEQLYPMWASDQETPNKLFNLFFRDLSVKEGRDQKYYGEKLNRYLLGVPETV